MLLKANPKGGAPMKRMGAVDYREDYPGFQYKIGYCRCGEKVLITPDERNELIERFTSRERTIGSVAKHFAVKILRRIGED